MDPAYGIIYALQGAKLSPQQTIDRLYRAGFTDVQELAIGFSVMMGESGGYLKAWHNNVVLADDLTPKLDGDGKMTIVSTDLGFIQRNVKHPTPVKVLPNADDVQAFIEVLWYDHPELARADESAKIAKELWDARGWTPWYAYLNGSYRKALPQACDAVKKYLAAIYLDGPWR